jgi:hypothetical protein
MAWLALLQVVPEPVFVLAPRCFAWRGVLVFIFFLLSDT